jgi:hypothetical protein
MLGFTPLHLLSEHKEAEPTTAHRQGFVCPTNFWAETSEGMPLESQLDDVDTGTYRGYPNG